MRRLILLRHAKAERAQPGEKDLNRVLTDGGRGDAIRVGAFMARHGLIPDQVLVSTSKRTRETWALLSKAFTAPPAARFEERIYEASPEAILKAIQDTAPTGRTLLVVGHNPSLHELASTLAVSGDIDARQRLKEDFPTAALAVIGFALEDWQGLDLHGGRLEHFVRPRELEAASD